AWVGALARGCRLGRCGATADGDLRANLGDRALRDTGLLKVVNRLVGTACDDLLRCRGADPRQILELLFARAVQVDGAGALGLLFRLFLGGLRFSGLGRRRLGRRADGHLRADFLDRAFRHARLREIVDGFVGTASDNLLSRRLADAVERGQHFGRRAVDIDLSLRRRVDRHGRNAYQRAGQQDDDPQYRQFLHRTLL